MRWCEAVDIPPLDNPTIKTTTAASPTSSPSPSPLATMSEAFRWGLSCGAASCMTGENSVFNRDEALELYKNHYHCDNNGV